MNEPELRIKPIRSGTVIDHITANKSLYLLNILGIPNESSEEITIAMNVSSKEVQKKDIVKIENRELKFNEINQIALIAPNATINIIRDYEIVQKDKVQIPNELNSIIECTNPKCITHTDEPLESKFYVIKDSPVLLRCHYCDRLIKSDEITGQFK